jgi:hypothetical protein
MKRDNYLNLHGCTREGYVAFSGRMILRFLSASIPFLVSGFPTDAHAHTGLESRMGYVILSGFAAGLIIGAVCVILRFSVLTVLIRTLAVLFVLLLAGVLFLPGVLWSEVFSSTIITILLVGIAMPLSLGAVAMRFAATGIGGIVRKWRRKP